ncbi:MAG: hypothetical protein V2I33_00840 [Kangiellaceae bacterium]|jgi:hypothetical protein|nr:hypothetical protein [Kangiellaceae bacterium]
MKVVKSYKPIALAIAVSTLLMACTDNSEEQAVLVEDVNVIEPVECELYNDDASNSECGIVNFSLTDADGDFLLYQVDVTGFSLTRADGLVVDLMPTAQSIDFASYVELSELVTAASIPVGVYTSGTISVSYANSDIQVELDGSANEAVVIDELGNPLVETSLDLQFDDDNQLIIRRARGALLEVDFNLAASHEVDLSTSPIEVTTEPFITAEVDPVDEKELRLRGPLQMVDNENGSFKLKVRPFTRNRGEFGQVEVQVGEETTFDIDGVAYNSVDGLEQLSLMSVGTPTLTQGLFQREDRNFTAATVLVGSSVPGADQDAVRGVITARAGDRLTLRGVTLVRQEGSASYHDELSVDIADTTTVTKLRRNNTTATTDDLSVGQAVSISGQFIAANEQQAINIFNATEGRVRMRLTAASGHQVSDQATSLTIGLQSLQGRPTDIYDFSGTGIDETFDADPDAYEVDVAAITQSESADGDPVRVIGYVAPFGNAPADFEAMSVINYANSRSQMVLSWPDTNETAAIVEITDTSFAINLADGGRYNLLQGGIRTPLSELSGPVTVVALRERGIYTIGNGDSVTAFSDFSSFITALEQAIANGDRIVKMHTAGGFVRDDLEFRALKIAVKIDNSDET